MTYSGKIKDGVVVLPPDAQIPEGAEVKVQFEPAPEFDPFVDAARKVAKPRPHWPDDYVVNHGHYVSGEPKKK
ncbi:MAG: hypothetical protein SGI88_10115 [Candidatus Hydrogenedentes bacterium]|nr:hypothetical protein [Candidatus Hydrogenedentota bacterium]